MAYSGGDAALTRLQEAIARQRRELEFSRREAASRSVIDLARGMLMHQLACSPDEASRQLEDLADRACVSVTAMAAEITSQDPPDGAHDARWHRLSLARPELEQCDDANALAEVMLEQILRPSGAVAVVLWRIETDGGMQIAGHAGLSAWEASRWQRIHPEMSTLPQEAARAAAELWIPAGHDQASHDPLVGADWPDGARAALPLRDSGWVAGVMLVCWPEPREDFDEKLRAELVALADTAAHAIWRVPVPGGSDDQSVSSVTGLLDTLLDGLLVASAIHDDDGKLVDFRINHLKGHLPGGPAASDEGATGARLLETYPWAASPGGLFDQCAAVLETGLTKSVTSDTAAAATDEGGTRETSTLRIGQFFGGVAMAWREIGDADRLAALLQHAQRLGRIGAWEENLETGDVRWTESTYQLFGLPQTAPVSITDLDDLVAVADLPSLRSFRRQLTAQRRQSAAAFRIIKADDGSERQIRAYAEPIGGTATATIVRGAYQDVSSDYHTQLAFAAAREQLADTEERALEDHRLAVRLQEAITPRVAGPVSAPGLDVAARYRPSESGTIVSGDWYDILELPNQHTLLVIGDIAGHGLDAVTGMVALRNALRGLVAASAQPADLLAWLNKTAYNFGPGLMGTAICGWFDPVSKTLRWARAGHLPPILARGRDADVLGLPRGVILGADVDASYDEATTSLRSGDAVVLYTDGLIERRGVPIDTAIAGLLDQASSPDADTSRYADHLLEQAAPNTEDDACLVTIRVR
ncbi:MAG: SpoIIE family protein phosphatase [Streptosporangiaceae bacterium]